MPTILISGGSNGLGAAFLEAYSKQEDPRLVCIDVKAPATKLANVEYFIVDIASETSIQRFVEQLGSRPIDLLIHSAGIRGLVPAEEERQPDKVEACETLAVMDVATLERTFRINAIGTFTLLRALLPNLRCSAHPKVVIMSSRMGSLGNNQIGNRAAGGSYAYRASKAALNALVRSLAVDEPSITFVLCHPGRVETKLVRCKEEGAISAEESISGLLPLIQSWNLSDSGRFYDRFGASIEW